ncbi:MAG: FtsX-like permease family protein [Firmicutes bacterium]|nr:FtsX-like permease family protein [Bacillota bacterium]
MRIRDLLSVAVRNSRLRLVESFLIVLGIALGVAVVAAFGGLVGSVGAQARVFAESPVAWEITVIPREEDYSALWDGNSGQVPAVAVGPAGARPVRLTMRDLERFRNGVTSAKCVYTCENIGLPLRPANPSSGDGPGAQGETTGAPKSDGEDSKAVRINQLEEQGFVELVATVPDYFRAYGLKPREGSFFVDSDVASGTRVMVVGDELARRLAGDTSPLGQELIMGSPGGGSVQDAPRYTVIGVLESLSPPSDGGRGGRSAPPGPLTHLDRLGFIPVTSAPGYSGEDEQLSEIRVMPASADAVATTIDELRRFIEREYQGRLTIRSEIDNMRRALREMRGIAVGILVIASAGIVIASINILNLMMARVLRRTKAIGISIALGASRGDVFAQLLTESLVLGIVGGVIGIGLAYVATGLISRVTQGLAVTVGAWGILAGTGASLVASVVFGLYPAHLAARTVAADALRGD